MSPADFLILILPGLVIISVSFGDSVAAEEDVAAASFEKLSAVLAVGK